MKLFFRWLCGRCPLKSTRDDERDRRVVSQAGRDRWEEFSRERACVEERLRLVDMQSKVIDHVTTARTPNGRIPT